MTLKEFLKKHGEVKTIAELVSQGKTEDEAKAMIAELTKEDKIALEAKKEPTEKEKELQKQLEDAEEKLKAFQHKPEEKKLLDPNEDPTCGFKCFAEQALAVVKFRESGKMDTRLEPLYKAAGTGSDTLTGPSGGFTIAPQFSAEILGAMPTVNPIVARTRGIPVAQGNTINIPALVAKDESTGGYFNGIQVYRRAEKQQLTGSAPEWAMIKLECEEIIGMTAPTNEMLRRSPISVDTLLRQMFTYAIGRQLEHEVIQGSGAAGQFLGLLESPAKYEQAIESGQTSADPIVPENITHMVEHLAGECSDPCWIIHPLMMTYLTLANKEIGLGGVMLNWFDLKSTSLANYPVFKSFSAKAPNTTGDIILTDLNFYLRAFEVGADQWDMSEHFLFDYNQTAFRIVMSNDGQCWWKSKRLEKDGSTETSPIVTLGTRP